VPVVLPLVELGILALVLWVVATALAIALIMDKLSAVLDGVPWIGGKLSGAVKSMAQIITNAAGTLESGIDKLIGASWHLLARYMDKLWHHIESQAAITARVAEHVGNLIYNHSGLSALVHRLAKAYHGIEHGIKTLTREYHGIERRVHALEKRIGKGIGHDLRAHLKALERRLGKVETQVIPAVESAETALANDISALGEYVRSNFVSVATDAVTAAVVVALGALGLGGLRCNSLLNSLKNRGCGLWNGLEDLLGLFVDVAIFTNVCAVLDFLSPFVSDVAGPIVTALTDIGAGLCAGSIGPPPELPVPALHLPASPGATLHLP
jgi:phage-related protein